MGKRLKIWALAGLIALSLALFPVFAKEQEEVGFNLSQSEQISVPFVAIVQSNTLLPVSKPQVLAKKVVSLDKVKVVVTGYSSSVWETDDTPHLTANGTMVGDGIVANNFLPFGAKIRLPEIYGDKIFVVEDRMAVRKGYYHIDIWFPSYWEALEFGTKYSTVEIIEG